MPQKGMIKFGEVLKSLLEARGWSPEEFASKLSFSSRQDIADYISGSKIPSVNQLREMTVVLKVTFHVLSWWLERKPPEELEPDLRELLTNIDKLMSRQVELYVKILERKREEEK